MITRQQLLLGDYTVTEIQAILRQANRTVTGCKNVLVSRALGSAPALKLAAEDRILAQFRDGATYYIQAVVATLELWDGCAAYAATRPQLLPFWFQASQGGAIANGPWFFSGVAGSYKLSVYALKPGKVAKTATAIWPCTGGAQLQSTKFGPGESDVWAGDSGLLVLVATVTFKVPPPKTRVRDFPEGLAAELEEAHDNRKPVCIADVCALARWSRDGIDWIVQKGIFWALCNAKMTEYICVTVRMILQLCSEDTLKKLHATGLVHVAKRLFPSKISESIVHRCAGLLSAKEAHSFATEAVKTFFNATADSLESKQGAIDFLCMVHTRVAHFACIEIINDDNGKKFCNSFAYAPDGSIAKAVLSNDTIVKACVAFLYSIWRATLIEMNVKLRVLSKLFHSIVKVSQRLRASNNQWDLTVDNKLTQLSNILVRSTKHWPHAQVCLRHFVGTSPDPPPPLALHMPPKVLWAANTWCSSFASPDTIKLIRTTLLCFVRIDKPHTACLPKEMQLYTLRATLNSVLWHKSTVHGKPAPWLQVVDGVVDGHSIVNGRRLWRVQHKGYDAPYKTTWEPWSSFINDFGAIIPALITYEKERRKDYAHVVRYGQRENPYPQREPAVEETTVTTMLDGWQVVFPSGTLTTIAETLTTIADTHKISHAKLTDYNLETIPGIGDPSAKMPTSYAVRVSPPATAKPFVWGRTADNKWHVVYCSEATTAAHIARISGTVDVEKIIANNAEIVLNITVNSEIPAGTAVRIILINR